MFSLDMSLDAVFMITSTNTKTDETVAVIQSDDTKYPDGQMGLFSASQEATCFSGFPPRSASSAQIPAKGRPIGRPFVVSAPHT